MVSGGDQDTPVSVSAEKDGIFVCMWLYILLSFAFYIPVAVGAGLIPMLGMLMIPKTICYILNPYLQLCVCENKSGFQIAGTERDGNVELVRFLL